MTYTVRAGDNPSKIAAAYRTTVTALAAANPAQAANIRAGRIQVNQVLNLPATSGAALGAGVGSMFGGAPSSVAAVPSGSVVPAGTRVRFKANLSGAVYFSQAALDTYKRRLESKAYGSIEIRSSWGEIIIEATVLVAKISLAAIRDIDMHSAVMGDGVFYSANSNLQNMGIDPISAPPPAQSLIPRSTTSPASSASKDDGSGNQTGISAEIEKALGKGVDIAGLKVSPVLLLILVAVGGYAAFK
jgi:hypothetical protein